VEESFNFLNITLKTIKSAKDYFSIILLSISKDLGKDADAKGYMITKTCLNMITFELAERLKGTNITANCLHPGVSQDVKQSKFKFK